MERDFKQWLALFHTSIANYQYYTYFDKVFSNVDAIKVELEYYEFSYWQQKYRKRF